MVYRDQEVDFFRLATRSGPVHSLLGWMARP